MCFACKLFNQFSSNSENTKTQKKELDIDAEDPFPLEGELVFQAQSQDKSLMKLCKKQPKDYVYKFIMDHKLVTYKNKIVVPKSLQLQTLQWYHHYLQHPGETRMYKTLQQSLYWPSMLKDITHICKTCKLCQISKRLKGKYSKIPPKDPDA